MAVDRTSLIARFPEFENAPTDLVTGSIADAKLVIDSGYYGTRYDSAVTWLAAHYIAINPLGELARLSKKGVTTTTYMEGFQRTKMACGTGFRVI